MAPIVVPAALGAVGFTSAGIVAGSVAAKAMSVAAPIPSGSLVATAQSAGAAGIGVTGKVIGAAVGAAVGKKMSEDN